MLAATGEDTTVTDVGSTKTTVVAAAGGSPRFVGGHPIAGKEVHGAVHASTGLFEGATWFLTPTAETSPERYALVHGFVGELGAPSRTRSSPPPTTSSSRSRAISRTCSRTWS